MSDRLAALLADRAALIRRFADELMAVDLEIATEQRHNLQSQNAAMLIAPYEDHERRITALEARKHAS